LDILAYAQPQPTGGETVSEDRTSSQQSDESLVEDLDVDEEAAEKVSGGRIADPCEGGEFA
jgi:hypothetical protein